MLRMLLTTLAMAVAVAGGAAAGSSCPAAGGMRFICGVLNPEDLVQVPGSNWIIASGMADAAKPGSGALTLIDATRAAAVRLYPSRQAMVKPSKVYGDCFGPPDADRFSAHGLNIRSDGPGRATLFVINHGREAVEVFAVDTRKHIPTLAWLGCVRAPVGAFFNSVAGLKDGRILATNFFQAPMTMQDLRSGKNTGAVYAWAPEGRFEKLPGTDAPGPNGIEVTPDMAWVFVAATGNKTLTRYDLAATDKAPWTMKLSFAADNLRWGPDGKLLAAGPGDAPDCKPAPGARCPQPGVIAALDPKTLTLSPVKTTAPEPAFQGLSSALIVGRTLWLGSHSADRVAYLPLDR
jgi:hypothetical protein